MQIITDSNAINAFRLATLISAAKLEAKGLKRRGRSATVILKEELGLSKRSSRDGAIRMGEEKLAKLREEL